MKYFYLTILTVISLNSFSAIKTWRNTNNSTTWTTPANWNPSGVPVNGDDIVIPTNNNGKYPSFSGTNNFNNITIDNGCSLTLSGATLTINSGKTLTNNGTITYNTGAIINNGTITNSNNTFTLGLNASLTNNGTFTINNFTPTGIFTNNGSVSIASLTINGGFTNNASLITTTMSISTTGSLSNQSGATTSCTLLTNNKNIINNGTLNITTLVNTSGDILNNGVIVLLSDIDGILEGIGTLTMNGSSKQYINTSSFVTNDLIVDNTAGVQINSGSTVYVNNELRLTHGVLTVAGDLVQDLNTGFISQTGTGSISGELTLKKGFVCAKTHYIASMLDNISLQEIQNQYEVVSRTVSNRTRLARFVPNTNSWSLIYDTVNTILNKDEGYSLYVIQTDLNKNGGDVFLKGGYTHNRTKTFNFASNSTQKYYLVPNIYPNTLLWDNTTKNGLTGVVYMWDPANSRYQTYSSTLGSGTNGGTSEIGAMQSFFVETDGTNTAANLTQNPSCVADFAVDLRKTITLTPKSQFKVTLTDKTTGLKDELILFFNEYGQLKYNNQMDASKFINPSPTPNVFVKKENTQLVMSNYPTITSQTDTTILLQIKTANSNNYQLDILPMGTVDSYLTIALKDSIGNYLQNILNNPTYTFNGQTNKTLSFGFSIASLSKTAVTTDLTQANSYYSDNTLHVNVNKSISNVKMDLYNTSGNLIATYNNIDLATGKAEVNTSKLPTGVYLLKISSNELVTTQKLLVE